MRPVPLSASVLFLVLCSAAPARAEDPRPGAVVTVTCKGNADQRYACYLPAAYTPDRKWPILFCFAPDAQGNLFVERYREVCERRGFIVVGSLNSRNGPWEPIKAAIDAMWTDTAERLSIQEKMRYATGFSGGARVSFGLAEMKPTAIAGVIAIGAGLSSTNRTLPTSLPVFMMCGETDPNRTELDALKKRFTEEGRPFRYEVFPGGHVMPENALLAAAVEWMDDQAPTRREERFAAALSRAEALRKEGEPVKAWILLVEALRADPNAKAAKEAEKLRKSLERDEAVKPEAAAAKKLEAAESFIEKNADRIGKSKSTRADAERRLREIGEKHPGTWADGKAREAIARLPAP